MRSLGWIEARTPEQAVAALQRGAGPSGAVVLKAGGVDLLDRLKEGLEAPVAVVNIRRATGHGLGELGEEPGASGGPPSLCIGALVTLARLAEDPLVARHAPALAEAARGVATPQIRLLATLGGNLLQRPRCWYLRSRAHPCRKKGGAVCFALDGENEHHAIFDNGACAAVHPSSTATALVAYGAEVAVLGPDGTRTAPLEALYPTPGAPGVDLQRDHLLGPAEVLCAVRIPIHPGRRGLYMKIRQRQTFDWPLAEAAVVLRRDAVGNVQEARVVLGAVAPLPWRARRAEAALLGLRRPEADALRRVAEEATASARPLSSNGYKLQLVRALVVRILRRLLTDGDLDAPR